MTRNYTPQEIDHSTSIIKGIRYYDQKYVEGGFIRRLGNSLLMPLRRVLSGDSRKGTGLFLHAAALTIFFPGVMTACNQERVLDDVRIGNGQAVKVQLENGADVNGTYQKPLLVVAAERGHTEVVRLFLEHGAKVDATTSAGQTALVSAAHRGSSD